MEPDFTWEMDHFSDMYKESIQADPFLPYVLVLEDWISFFACYLLEQPKWKEIN